jgi:MerR family copper efflux transcriptional regulator
VTRYTVQEAGRRSGWSPRMLRYLEDHGLLSPRRTEAGYRLYDERDIERLERLKRLRDHFGFGLDDLAFALRLRREPFLEAAVNVWLEPVIQDWLAFEQAKHERLLAA